MKKTKVSIIGGAGYGAAELLRHLLVRDDVDVVRISSKDYIGDPISKVHQTLTGFDHLLMQDISPRECARDMDIVFLAMPHVITARVAMKLFDMDVRIIDLSGDFRLNNLDDYLQDYAPEHPCPERLGSFVYGMPELNSDAITKAQYVASPGCFASAISLGLLPLAHHSLLRMTTVRNVSMTGSSGSGVKPQVGTHHALRANNMKAYKILTHQHRAEIIQTLQVAGAEKISLDFVPVSAPLVRGILSISQIDLPDGHTEESIHRLYEKFYEKNRLIHILQPGISPQINAVKGSSKTEISITVSEDHEVGKKTLCCISAIDNLIKGGAGQAIQSFNLMTGKPQNHGLELPGLWP